MSWRMPLTIMLCIVLVLPLILLVSGVVGRWQGQGQIDTTLSPILSVEERRQLLTFERPCEKREDCEAPLGCLPLSSQGPNYCVASECETDLQCDQGLTCQVLETLGNGPRVRFCVPQGRRKEGEPCLRGASIHKNACEEGLLCAGFCGRRCEADVPESCPAGYTCKRGPDGFSCLPTCQDRGCSAGQECVDLSGGVSVCASVVGQNCQRQSCEEGARCSVAYPKLEQGRLHIKMECVLPASNASNPRSLP
jgi:hypothetical protein